MKKLALIPLVLAYPCAVMANVVSIVNHVSSVPVEVIEFKLKDNYKFTEKRSDGSYTDIFEVQNCELRLEGNKEDITPSTITITIHNKPKACPELIKLLGI